MKGWRTLVFNALVTALASIQAADLATIVPDQYIPLALAAVGLVNLALRTITTTPIGVK